MIKFAFLFLIFINLFFISNSQSVVINEFMSSNSSANIDEDGDNEDWIEIYNLGNETVNLKNYGLSDDLTEPFKWVFPNISIKPNAYIIVYASGKNKVNIFKPLHTNFSIKSSGENIILTNPENKQIDKISPLQLPVDISYGRFPDGTDNWLYYTNATPYISNTENGFEELLSAPEISYNSGFYETSFYLKVIHNDTKVVVRYTLDGSIPDENSKVFPDSLLVYNRKNDYNIISLIPTTSHSYEWCAWKKPIGSVYKCTNIRIKAFKKNALSLENETRTFWVDKNIFTRYSIPIISISINNDDLFDTLGIFENYDARGNDWERQCHISFYENDGFQGFSTDAGIRLHGANSRKFAQKGFKIYFRNKYGENEIDYPVFPEQPEIKYNQLIIRNGGSDWNKSFIRDVFVQSILDGYSDIANQAYRPVILFLNGEYYGVMQLRERYNKKFIEEHYGYKNVDLLRDSGKIILGTNDNYFKLLQFIEENDIKEPENYNYVKSQIEIDNYIDFIILQIFSMNTDQPGKNLFFWKPDTTSGKWQFMLYDMDDTFGFGEYNTCERDGLIYSTGLDSVNSLVVNNETPPPLWAPNTPKRTFLLRTLLQNSEFQTKFINRFADLLNTAFQPEFLKSKIDSFYYQIDDYMDEQYKRWLRPKPERFEEQLTILYNFAEGRQNFQRKHIIDFFNLEGEVEIELKISDYQQGHIKINSIEINNLLPCFGENPYPWKCIYFKNIPVTVEAIPNVGYEFSNWNENKADTTRIKIIYPEDNITLTANFK